MADIKTIKDIDVAGKRVLVRVDFNVPLKNGAVSDDTRITAALPTIKHLADNGAKVILCSHLGRPKGEPKPEFSLKPVAQALARKIGKPVLFVDACVGEKAEEATRNLGEGEIALLENVRFHNEETDNDPAFAKQLAGLADVYVNDAFGTAHRAHASTAGVVDHIDTCAVGFLIEKELQFLGDKTNNPEHPFVVILGGAKVSDKINVIDALLDKADTILIGGGMAYTFKLALGQTVGDSLCEPDKKETAASALEKAKQKGVKFMIPLDNLITNALDFGGGTVGETKIVEGDIPDGWEGVDIGPKTVEAYNKEIARAKTILWNGPMGIFEIDACNKGTFAMAKAVAESAGTTIIGGGDSVKAINAAGYGDKVTFMSTGGGASLEFLEGKELPGVKAIQNKS